MQNDDNTAMQLEVVKSLSLQFSFYTDQVMELAHTFTEGVDQIKCIAMLWSCIRD